MKVLVLSYDSEPFPAQTTYELTEYIRRLGIPATGYMVKTDAPDTAHLNKMVRDFAPTLVISVNHPRQVFQGIDWRGARFITYVQDRAPWQYDPVIRDRWNASSDWILGYSNLAIEYGFDPVRCVYAPLFISPNQFCMRDDYPRPYLLASIHNRGDGWRLRESVNLQHMPKQVDKARLAKAVEALCDVYDAGGRIDSYEDLEHCILVEYPELPSILDPVSYKTVMCHCLYHDLNETLRRAMVRTWVREIVKPTELLWYGADWPGAAFMPNTMLPMAYRMARYGLHIGKQDEWHHRITQVLVSGAQCVAMGIRPEWDETVLRSMSVQQYRDQQDNFLFDCMAKLNEGTRPVVDAPSVFALGTPSWFYDKDELAKVLVKP